MVSKNSPVILNNRISVKVATEYSGYSLQYLCRLLRLGKLAGLKIAQLWLIDKTEYEAYLKNAYKTPERRFDPKNYCKS